jgi:UDP-N-acetylglucosamine:LPS N-acetylglucosamine transferase
LAAGTVPPFILSPVGGEREKSNAQFCADIGFGSVITKPRTVWAAALEILNSPAELEVRRQAGCKNVSRRATKVLCDTLLSGYDR